DGRARHADQGAAAEGAPGGVTGGGGRRGGLPRPEFCPTLAFGRRVREAAYRQQDISRGATGPLPFDTGRHGAGPRRRLIDANAFSAGTELAADICIIGAGAAGLIVAHELAQTGRDILLLESGGHGPSPATAALMTGRAVTRPGFQLAGARRQLGGSFNDW